MLKISVETYSKNWVHRVKVITKTGTTCHLQEKRGLKNMSY